MRFVLFVMAVLVAIEESAAEEHIWTWGLDCDVNGEDCASKFRPNDPSAKDPACGRYNKQVYSSVCALECFEDVLAPMEDCPDKTLHPLLEMTPQPWKKVGAPEPRYD